MNSMATTSTSATTPTSVGECIAQFLVAQAIEAVFGVISIHNMPILDAIGRCGNLRFVPSRGEAGAVNMADACARVSGKLSVAFTSTGTGAGNAAGALIEAYTAGSPVLHITGQIESRYLDQNLGYIHEAPAQLAMLQSVGKAAYRVGSPEELIDVLPQAAAEAMTPPMGPVSIEIPVDVQAAALDTRGWPGPVSAKTIAPASADIERAAKALRSARRPMIWLGGGARRAGQAATALANRGVGVVTSTSGRAIVAEDHPLSLAAFNLNPHAQALYDSVDLLLVVGSRLRSNETWTYKLDLPQNMIRVDCDAGAEHRTYPHAIFVHADSVEFLTQLEQAVDSLPDIDPTLAADIAQARALCVQDLRADLGPYAEFVDVVQTAMPEDAIWVRDVTLSNSMWGNRLPPISRPEKGVHALGGGIGQGLPMAVGAACGGGGSKTLLLSGDGGLSLCLGELVTAAEQNVNVSMILMNDQGYGVIQNIQDAHYGGRKYYSKIFTPKFAEVARSIDIPHTVVGSIEAFRAALNDSLGQEGFSIVEVDMTAIGPFARDFAGPPQKHDC